MGILTNYMKRLVNEQQLGFHATVCPDGSPNLSPKGATRVWDDDHLFSADICFATDDRESRAGSLIEVNVVDPLVRKGYRFKGAAVIHEPGAAEFAEGIERMRAGGSKLTARVKAIVVIEVQQAEPLISPAYGDGTTTEATCSQPTACASQGCTGAVRTGSPSTPPGSVDVGANTRERPCGSGVPGIPGKSLNGLNA